MRIMAWNCRGLGSPSTVPQLKESLRFFKPELVFLSETKRKAAFVSNLCAELGWDKRWHVVDPVGRSGGLLLGWSNTITVYQVVCTAYSMEVELESADTQGKVWVVLVYASVNERIRLEQWEALATRSQKWGDRWILGGGF